MPPAKDSQEALYLLHILLSQTPERSKAREIMEASLPVLDAERDAKEAAA